jgi:predicted HAD superfamily phosphohydrolase YqeG
MNNPLVVYVDVDDTLVRQYGSTRMPIPHVIDHVKQLREDGVQLFCWSTGGAEYAEEAAREFGIHDCFSGFLPKPDALLDDMALADWRSLVEIHPNSVRDEGSSIYRATPSV